MPNPAYGALTPRFAGTLRSDSQNVEQVTRSRSRNMFDMSFENYLSLRFGEVRPFLSERCVDRDSATLSNDIELWSNTLKSPLMSGLTMYKDYFYIPFKAIYPNGWDAFKNTPIQGDDVPSDVYGNFPLQAFCQAIYNYIINYKVPESISDVGNITAFNCWKSFVLILNVLSTDSLLHQLHIDTSGLFSFVRKGYHDAFERFDQYLEKHLGRELATQLSKVSSLASALDITMTITAPDFGDGVSSFKLTLATRESPDSDFFINRSDFWEFMRYAFVDDVIIEDDNSRVAPVLFSSALYEILGYYMPQIKTSLTSQIILNAPALDLSELYAYQMIGAQFYVNDNVDVIFTSKDWLDNLIALLRANSMTYSLGSQDFFDNNGASIPYDVLSIHNVRRWLNYIITASPSAHSNSGVRTVLDVFANIFLPFESLRYGDYFTGSRLSPLAIGADVHAVAPVTSNEVQAVDMTIALSWQSYLNDIMKLGPVAWIQQNGIYGDVPTSLDPMPRFISRERQSIGAMQIENTSENQGKIVSRFRSEFQQYAYQCDIREDSIIMGLVSFDVPRIYQNTTSRFAFTYDRHDFFQPYFQNIGDQSIYLSELALSHNPKFGEDFSGFSYQLRDTQYKQRYNRCSGAFCGDFYLPSWAMIDDNSNWTHLNSELVRNHNRDFDRFFESLPNFMPAGYFHFYIRVRNYQTFTRAMQYRPDIQTPSYHM